MKAPFFFVCTVAPSLLRAVGLAPPEGFVGRPLPLAANAPPSGPGHRRAELSEGLREQLRALAYDDDG